MRELNYPKGKSYRQWGEIHGETFREEIMMLAELRLYLAKTVGGFKSDEDVLELAGKHAAVSKAFCSDLHSELEGIAHASGVSLEKIIVLNHYTDLRDLGPASTAGDGGCTVVYSQTKTGPILAQTWDMHASAIPYVMMIHIPEEGDNPAASVLSLTGCLGMAGLNSHGVGVAINNLASTDARIGVVWSSLVRKALLASSAEGARPVFKKENIGSGHHYLVADKDSVFALEASGTTQDEVYSGAVPWFCHTNHCLSETVEKHSRVSPTSTTYGRMSQITSLVTKDPVVDAEDAYEKLGSQEGFPNSLCTNQTTPLKPHAPATCGAISMDLKGGYMLAVGGFPHNVAPEKFIVSGQKHKGAKT